MFRIERNPRLAKDCTPEENKKYNGCWEKGGFRFWEGIFDDLLTYESSNKSAFD